MISNNDLVKPEELLLPPDFINDKEFHEFIVESNRLRLPSPLIPSKYKLWYTVIIEGIYHRTSDKLKYGSKDFKLDIIKNFCADIKGLYIYKESSLDVVPDVGPTLLYLEKLFDIPLSLIDDSFINELSKKYNYQVNIIVAVNTVNTVMNYILLDTHSKYLGGGIKGG